MVRKIWRKSSNTYISWTNPVSREESTYDRDYRGYTVSLKLERSSESLLSKNGFL